MTAVSPPLKAELHSPEEMDQLNNTRRLHYYSEDWVTEPRRADSGAALGPQTQAQVRELLQRGMDEAEIREAALAAIAAEEQRIIVQHRRKGWAAVAACVSVALIGALTWQGRGDGHHMMNVLLLGSIGLMIAHAIRSRGTRIRTRMLVSVDARKDIWRKAIAAL